MIVEICGIDGSGKTTQREALVNFLREEKVLVRDDEPVRQPKEAAEALQKFQATGICEINFETLALYWAASRALFSETVVNPGLAAGQWFVFDRYLYSALAYFALNGVDRAFLATITRRCIRPSLVLYLDVSGEIALKRIRGRGGAIHYEESTTDRLEEYARSIRNSLPEQAVRIQSAPSKSKVTSSIIEHVSQALVRKEE